MFGRLVFLSILAPIWILIWFVFWEVMYRVRHGRWGLWPWAAPLHFWFPTLLMGPYSVVLAPYILEVSERYVAEYRASGRNSPVVRFWSLLRTRRI